MTFQPAFSRVFSPAFPQAAGAVSPWWLSGGVSAANAIAVYQPKNAASQAASYTNLTGNATYNTSSINFPTWSAASGWIFNGTTQYLDTSIIVSAVTWSVIIRFSDRVRTVAELLTGARITNRSFQIGFDTVADTVFYGHGGNASLNVAPRITSGVLAISNKATYRNGVSDGTIAAGTTLDALPLYIGAYNQGNNAQLRIQANVQAYAVYDISGQKNAVAV